VSMGPIVEAWGNFGMVGVIVIGAFFGVFFSIPMLLAAGRTDAQVGFLMGVLFLRVASNTEATLGPGLIAFAQSCAVSIPLLYLLFKVPGSRRRYMQAPRTTAPRLPVASETTATHMDIR